ncbi:hypothetical protein CLOM_g12264 [Closterium sp. NIES-68]|nr:hypothetical protein CLOM_g12264 [Closterium sp. NIES-68]
MASLPASCHVSPSHRTLLPVRSNPAVDFIRTARRAPPRRQRAFRVSVPRAQADDGPAQRSGPRWDPLLADSGTDCPVPEEQQPINEYQSLLESAVFPWVTLDRLSYALRLVGVGVAVAALIGWPVASLTFDPKRDALQCLLGSLGGGQLAVTLAALRLYLGWSYIGNRLFSATVEYEETGWYDGQVWVKTPELLARDRLLASYKVKPVLNRLKTTLLGLGLSLAATTALLFLLPSSASSPSSLSNLTPASYIPDSSATSALTAQQEQRAGDPWAALPSSGAPIASPTPSRSTPAYRFNYLLHHTTNPPTFLPHSPSLTPLSSTFHLPGFLPVSLPGNPLLPPPFSIEDDSLYSQSEAAAVAQSLSVPSSRVNVLIIGEQQQHQGDAEWEIDAVPGRPGLPTILGVGVQAGSGGRRMWVYRRCC